MPRSNKRRDVIPANVAKQLEELCTKIGNEVADERGFVPVRSLLARFQVDLVIRPLLVEGMLATVEETTDAGISSRWLVLVDEERHKVKYEALRAESSSAPLSNRFRNTVAHELVHSLAFRHSAFGLRLNQVRDPRVTAEQLVLVIERETERLSPLLLFPDRALRKLTAETSSATAVGTFATACREAGVSPYIFINRLKLLQRADPHGFLERQCFKDMAVGIVEWKNGTAAARNWPIFMRFDRNVIPEFILDIAKQDRLTGCDMGVPASSALCGGEDRDVRFECSGRTTSSISKEPMTVVCSVEARKTSGESLFVVSKTR